MFVSSVIRADRLGVWRRFGSALVVEDMEPTKADAPPGYILADFVLVPNRACTMPWQSLGGRMLLDVVRRRRLRVARTRVQVS
jgi:hypothetical protein